MAQQSEQKMNFQPGQQQQHMGQPMMMMHPQQPMRLAERVELFIACGDATKSDTFCAVYLKHSRAKDFELLDKTEVINGYQNPTRWTTKFRLDYFFEEEQTLKFDVYSQTKKGIKTKKN